MDELFELRSNNSHSRRREISVVLFHIPGSRCSMFYPQLKQECSCLFRIKYTLLSEGFQTMPLFHISQNTHLNSRQDFMCRALRRDLRVECCSERRPSTPFSHLHTWFSVTCFMLLRRNPGCSKLFFIYWTSLFACKPLKKGFVVL